MPKSQAKAHLQPDVSDIKNAIGHRSWTMSRVGSKNTRPELAVRKAAHALGLRFRLHKAGLPGKPDLFLAKYRTAVFVNGCFWHSHPNCNRARIPSSNTGYWIPKLRRNAQRDAENVLALRQLGLHSVVVWECETADPAKLTMLLRKRIMDMGRRRADRRPPAEQAARPVDRTPTRAHVVADVRGQRCR
jgi:DNA mismatch endonuclease, patch repair protein